MNLRQCSWLILTNRPIYVFLPYRSNKQFPVPSDCFAATVQQRQPFKD
jgi:hypothetical protein